MTQFLRSHAVRALDVDNFGRVFACRGDLEEPGATAQLVELHRAAEPVELARLNDVRHARYVPGERAAIVEHGHQLSLLRLDSASQHQGAELVAITRDRRYTYRLLDVLTDRVLYATDRRNGIDFDVVIYGVLTGKEQVIYDRGGVVTAASVSEDGRYVVLTMQHSAADSDQLVLVDTMPPTEHEHVVVLTEAGKHEHVDWLPDDSGVVLTTDTDRGHSGIAAYDLAQHKLRWLMTTGEHDLAGWLSPDGTTLLALTDRDGAADLALHDSITGRHLRGIELPGQGWYAAPLAEPRWSANSRYVVLTFSAPSVSAKVLLLDLAEQRMDALIESTAS